MQRRLHAWQREPWSHKANRAIRHYQYQLRDWGSVAQPLAGAHRGSARTVPPQWAQTHGDTQHATAMLNQSKRHRQYHLRDWGSVAQPQAGAHRGSARAVPPQWAQTLGGTQLSTTKANPSNSNQHNQGITPKIRTTNLPDQPTRPT